MAHQRKTGFVQRPDAAIYYEAVGSGPGLVFAHGLGGNHMSWWQQVAAFADRFTCVSFAHRGFTPSHAEPAAAGARMAREQPALHLLYQEIDALTPPDWKTAIRQQLFALRTTPAVRLRQLGVPTLWIVGDEDIVFPAVAAPALARLMPKAEVARVPDAGHSVYFERPQRFNELVETFLAG